MLNKKRNIFLIFICLISVNCYSQEDIIVSINDSTAVSTQEFNTLAPAKAAFYSAILPGLGQAYNKKYWKIPIVYGALGTGIYFYSRNNTNYSKYRNAFKLMKDGKPHEFDGVGDHILLSEDVLVRAQKLYKKDRDLSLLITIGLYFLQILEASTNAHLLQHNVDNDLTFSPQLIKNTVTDKHVVGVSLNFNF